MDRATILQGSLCFVLSNIDQKFPLDYPNNIVSNSGSLINRKLLEHSDAIAVDTNAIQYPGIN